MGEDIIRMRRELINIPRPSPYSEFQIEVFSEEQHKMKWLKLNNVIFENHISQGNWSIKEIDNLMSENWFNPDGFFLAVSGDQIQGFVITKVERSQTQLNQYGELFVVGTHPHHTRKGIARNLCIHSLRYFEQLNLEAAELYTSKLNYSALSLYESLGFHKDL